MRNIIAVFTVLLLASCATGPSYKEKTAGWKGATEKELVTAWGVPDKTYQLDNRTKMLAYVKRRKVFYPGSGFNTCFGSRAGVGYVGNCFGGYPERETRDCETTFMITNGRVTNTGFKGNACY
ncbi:MAG: hypothetical protein ACAH80_09335 [Alphaproteobacteria bacterium]